MPEPFRVLIIGGGIGGLCLAQGLRRAGIAVSLFERDRCVTDRLQGYRIHISPKGSRSLHDCLPPELFATFAATCGQPPASFRMMTERMETLISIDDFGDAAPDPIERHRSVSRITLRQVLLSGLEDTVQFDKAFDRYTLDGDRVVAHFEDGSSAEGDVLVAADGGGSRVRRQYLPHAERVDTGVVGIAGKVFLDSPQSRRIPPPLRNAIALVSGPNGRSLFVAPQVFTHPPTQDIDVDADAGALFDNPRSYVMWAFGAQRHALGLASDAAPDGEVLRGVALANMAEWDPGYRDLVNAADTDTLSLLSIRTSRPVPPWPTSRVTLLGDAIHSMTPYRGIGANVALRDAALLCAQLKLAARGKMPLLEAIHDYEQDMIEYGFAAVSGSLEAMQAQFAADPFRRAIMRGGLRMIDRVPRLKQWFFAARTAE